MAKKEKPPAGPDDLVRASAGAYRSGDGRFEVQKSGQGWFVVDSEQANEFGQQLIHGPFATLDDVRAAVPASRDIKPLLRSARRPSRTAKATPPAPAKKAPKPHETWIDRLPRHEATEVRRLIRVLERAGVKNAEALVRKDRGGLPAAVAQALLGRALTQALETLPEKERAAAAKFVRRIGEVLDAGTQQSAPLPGWALYELGPGREPTRRRLRLDG